MASRISPGTLIVVVVLFILIFNPSSSTSSDFEQDFVDSVLTLHRANLNVTVSAAFDDFKTTPAGGNVSIGLAGFKHEHGFYWNRLPAAQEQARSQLGFALRNESGEVLMDADQGLLVYHNISGWVKGHWTRSDADALDSDTSINRTKFDQRVQESGRALTHNTTGDSGKLHISLKERPIDPSAPFVSTELGDVFARVTLEDESSSGDGWEFTLKGIHDHRFGNIILTTTSNK